LVGMHHYCYHNGGQTVIHSLTRLLIYLILCTCFSATSTATSSSIGKGDAH